MRQREPPVEHVRDVASVRIPRLFAYFFDIHFLAEKGVKRFETAALREMRLAMRLAVALADEVLVPAASYYESELCRDVLTEYDPELFNSQISLVASGTSLDEFIEAKLSQYGPTQVQGRAYRTSGLQQVFPWRSRKRSATEDIKSDWLTLLKSGGMEALFRTARSYLPQNHDRIFEQLPEQLGEAAFIVPNVIPLLFDGKTTVALMIENGLHAIVNQSYFGSYAQDLDASVFQNMIFLQSPICVPSGDPDHDLDFRKLVDACRRHGVLADIWKFPVGLLYSLVGDPRFVAASLEASPPVGNGPAASQMGVTNPSKRRRPKASSVPAPKILIVTALPKEAAAVRATFDAERTLGVPDDPHIYWIGTYKIEGGFSRDREVLLASQSDMGKANAATVASHALRSFPSIEHVIMVGIAGGCPNAVKADEHVRLGDIVFSDETGIVEYDDIKVTPTGTEYRGSLQKPSYRMLQGIRALLVNALLGQRPWETYSDTALEKKLDAAGGYARPGEDTDILHDPNGNVIPHPVDAQRRLGRPNVRGGGIATADTLLKDPQLRDELRDRFRVKAIEMEGSGIQTASWAARRDYLVVRGICDYCDVFKSDTWQAFAALSAAAFTRALIDILPEEWYV
jgi:nucleoside phosphorylase